MTTKPTEIYDLTDITDILYNKDMLNNKNTPDKSNTRRMLNTNSKINTNTDSNITTDSNTKSYFISLYNRLPRFKMPKMSQWVIDLLNLIIPVGIVIGCIIVMIIIVL